MEKSMFVREAAKRWNIRRNTTLTFNGDFMREAMLPNREISLVYHKEILQQLGGYYATSNRESGDGSFDIQLKLEKKDLPGILAVFPAEAELTMDT